MYQARSVDSRLEKCGPKLLLEAHSLYVEARRQYGLMS